MVRTNHRRLWPALLLLLASCATDAPLDTLDPAGPAARQITGLFWPVFWIAVAIFVLVEGAIVVFMLFFRDKEGRRLPRQVHGNTRLEVVWTAIPALILVGVGYGTVATIFNMRSQPADALQVTVTANQWWWEFEYPQLGLITANELHIPVERPVYLTLQSVDVIHSFWVPRLAGKQDVVPGRIHNLTIEASEPGVYWGQCAEFCGLSHALMRLRVFADTEEDFAAWTEAQLEPPVEPSEDLTEQGVELFTGACVSCHTIQGISDTRVGPNLTHFASRTTFAGAILDNTPQNLARWLRDPPAVKPGSKMPNLGLGPEDIQALVAYLESLE